ncbi:MAG: putative RND superfamily exporter protein [Flavobacteriales bacterium]|jgi:predicted RND superfamily exporter protein
MWAAIARIILRNRLLFLILIGLVTAFMAYQGRSIQMSYHFARLLPIDDPVSLEYQRFKDVFGEEASLMVLGINDSSIFELEHFRSWAVLAENLKKEKGVTNVVSVTDLYDLKVNEEKEEFEFVPLSDGLPETQEQVNAIRDRLNELPIYNGVLLNKETGAVLMVISLDKDIMDTEKRVQLIEELDTMINAFSVGSNIVVHRSGLPYIRTRNAQSIKKEINIFIMMAMAVTALILMLFFKSFKAMLFSMLVVAVGVVWSVGIIGMFGYEITILTALIPPLIIVIGVPNCVFLLNKYHQEYRHHGNKMKALSRVIQRIGNATLMTNATTASGFATFILTQSGILVEFGVVASISILCVFVLSILLIPIIFSLIAPPKTSQMRHLEKKWVNGFVEWMVRIVQYHRPGIYISMCILIVVAFFGVRQIRVTGSITEDIPRTDKIYIDLKFFESNFSGVMPFEVVIDTKQPNGVMKISTLRKMDQLSEVLKKYPEVSRAMSISDMVKFGRQAFYNGDQKFYEIPNAQEKNFILGYLPEDDSKMSMASTFLDSTRSIARISAGIADIGTSEMAVLQESLQKEIEAIFDSERYDVSVTGTSVVYLAGTRYLVKNLFISLMLAVVLIALFMSWMFRSARMVVVSLLPNLIPLLFTAAIMGYAGITIKPSTILVFSIAFGISVDDTIHYLAKYRQELNARNWNIRLSVIAALRDTGVSMIYTSIVLFFGFSIFTASQFGGTIALGMLVSITLMIAMISNLILLPTLLLTLERYITTRSFKEPMIHILDEEEDIDLDELEVEGKIGLPKEILEG